MAQATDTTTEEQLIAGVQAAFAAGDDSRGQAQAIADHLRQAFVAGWPENSAKIGDGDGSFLIHADDKLGHPNAGFKIFAYRQPPQPESPQAPHDHGPCFVVYGVAEGSNVQTRYAWRYDADTTKAPTLEKTQELLQKPGEASYFLPGEIHSTQGSRTEQTVYVRITSQDLDDVWRHRYHLEHSTSRAFISGTSPGK
ncbi:MAG: hypothetical protein O3B65_01555 [Chloroflexi bacterium]|nr:hypothetical protein [Chloroflexota bacterium]